MGTYNNEVSLILIHDTYILCKKLGKGSFGDVYKGRHKWTGKPVAIKLEAKSSKTRILEHEYKVYQDIYRPNSGIVECHHFGLDDDYAVLVIDLLGDSLGTIINRGLGNFSLKTVLLIADQMISRIEYIHENGYIHRDLKPDNMLIGKNHQQNQIFLIDFGLAKKYWKVDGQHIELKEGGKLVGTARYASINSHMGYTLSRRDDLISLGYVLIYFAKGSLPWQKIGGIDKEKKYHNIMNKKKTTPNGVVCSGLPHEFEEYMDYCMKLDFSQRPDYNHLRKLFKKTYIRCKFPNDLVFDWNKTPNRIKKKNITIT